MFTISKATKIASWDDLKKTREAPFDVGNGKEIILRGITEGERSRAVEKATEMRHNEVTKETEEKINEDELAFYLIIDGWVEPEMTGGSFKQNKETLSGLPYEVLKKIARKIDELSDIERTDIEKVKNV